MQVANQIALPQKIKELAEEIMQRKVTKEGESSIRRDFSPPEITELGVRFFASMLKVLSSKECWIILRKIDEYGKIPSKGTNNLKRNLERLEEHGLIREIKPSFYSLSKLGKMLLDSNLSLSHYLDHAKKGEQNMVLLQLLISGGEKSFSELKKALPLNVGSLYRNLRNLENLGYVEKISGKYNASSNATLKSLRDFCNFVIQEIKKMQLHYYKGELIAYSLSEESTYPPPNHKLKYFALEDLINDHVVVTYAYESEKSREEIVKRIIYEQTRWKGNTCKPLPPEHVGKIQIAYDINQLASLQQLLNLFCLHAIKSFDGLMVEEIYVPERFRNKFELKPRFGIKGIRDILGVHERPLLHVVIPPYLKGKEETAKFIQQLFEAGVDAVGDHQFIGLGLTEFKERIEKVVEIIEDYSQKFSQKMIFYPYIEGENFIEKIDAVKDAKCKYVGLGLSPISFGIPATIFVRKKYCLPLHLHLTLHGIYTRLGQSYYSPKEGFRSGHGISINVILKLFALCGGDEVNVDYYGYYSVHPKEVKTHCGILWRFNIFPALVGGIGLDNIQDVVRDYGKDVVAKVGGERFLKFLEKEQIKSYIKAYKSVIENTMEGKFEDSEEIKKWKNAEKSIKDAVQKFLIGFPNSEYD